MKDHKISIIIVSIIYLLYSLLLTVVPLFNYLGYEFSFVSAIICSFVSGLFTVLYLKKKSSSLEFKSNDYISVIKKIYKINLSLLLIPLIVGSANAFFVKNCSFLNGILFFVLLPVVGVLFSTSLAVFSFSVFQKFNKTLFVFLYLGIIFYSVLIYYLYPQLFQYNPIAGYFSGLVYDEDLSISMNLILYRFNTLFECAFLLFVSITILKRIEAKDKFKKRLSYIKNLFSDNKISLLVITILIVFRIFKNEMNIINGETYIQTKLGAKFTTTHFEIYYSEENINREKIVYLAKLHEFYYKQISEKLKTNTDAKIKSYIYPTSELKSSLIGARNTNIAKPWLYQIHINENSIDEVLKHELVHIMAGEFGLPLINASMNMGLVEGLAMAIEWDWGSRTLHQYSSLLHKMDMIKNIEEVFSNIGFAFNNSSTSYILSGSFCRWLIDTYGIDFFKNIYSGNDFKQVYNKDLNNLSSEYLTFIKNIPVSENDTTLIKYYFKRPSIFQKVCARVIANILKDAYKEMSLKNYPDAIIQYQKVLRFTNSNEARIGIITSFFQLNEYDSVITSATKVVKSEIFQDSYLPIRLYLGDAYWLKAMKTNRIEFIDSANVQYEILKKAYINDNYNFITQSRLEILKDTILRKEMIYYYIYKNDEFIRAIKIKEAIGKTSDFYIGNLIIAKVLFNKSEYKECISYLNKILNENISEVFLFEKYKLFGECHFYLLEYSKAKEYFNLALNYTKNEATKNELEQLIEKSDFFEQY